MKYKIGIYCPALNEEKHVNAWYESCKEADIISVADTGSTDNTVKLLTDLGVKVTSISIKPWRFDLAFNVAMSLLPSDIDICIRLDLDERLQPGWREALEAAWTPQTNRVRYTYVWSWVSPGVPGLSWYGDRIHSRSGYIWQGATHEGLCFRSENEVQTICDDIKIYHFPEAKNKKNDLKLLLEAVKEYPLDARLKAYLGREYMYQGMNEKSTETYKEFLSMSWDKSERQQAMCNLAKTDPANKVFWLKLAVIDAPEHREPLCELAQFYYEKQDWYNCLDAARRALEIKNNPRDYTCLPENWSWRPHDLYSIAAWNLKMYPEALSQAKIALSYLPTDVRLQNNVAHIENYIKEHLL